MRETLTRDRRRPKLDLCVRVALVQWLLVRDVVQCCVGLHCMDGAVLRSLSLNSTRGLRCAVGRHRHQPADFWAAIKQIREPGPPPAHCCGRGLSARELDLRAEHALPADAFDVVEARAAVGARGGLVRRAELCTLSPAGLHRHMTSNLSVAMARKTGALPVAISRGALAQAEYGCSSCRRQEPRRQISLGAARAVRRAALASAAALVG